MNFDPVKKTAGLGRINFLNTRCKWDTLPETNIASEMDGWKTIVSFWEGLFSGANC